MWLRFVDSFKTYPQIKKCVSGELDCHTFFFSVNFVQKDIQNIEFSSKNHLSFLTHEAYSSKWDHQLNV